MYNMICFVVTRTLLGPGVTVIYIALIIIPLSLMSRRKGRGSKTFTFGGSVWDLSKSLFGGPSVV